MPIDALYRDIGLPPEITSEVSRISETITPAPAQIETLLNSKTAEAAYQSIRDNIGPDPRGLKMLTIQLTAALTTRKRYAKKAIDDIIFIETMKCFTRFVREHMVTFGHYGFDRGWWTYRQLAMSIFRLGVLEFEMLENHLSVHIPSDAVMTRQRLDDSYAWAKRFFAKHFSHYKYDGMYCDTWLLSPVLQEILPPTSKILNFQADYEIISTEPEADSFMLWVFKKEYPDIDSLPEDTSLQRAIKNRLKSGGKIGNAYGRVKPRGS